MATPTYNPNSVVDTLKSQGQASDFASRAKLAGEKGILNYAGTAEQNTELNKLVTPPAVVTSKKAVTDVNNNLNTLNSASNQAPAVAPGYKAVKVGNSWSTVPVGSAADITDQMRASGATQEQINNALSGSLGAPLIGNNTDKTPVPPPAPKSEVQVKLDDTAKELENLGSRISASSVNTINAIKQEYDSLIKQQETSNKNYQGAITQEGIRSGRARYASDIFATDNAKAVEFGISAISNLQTKKERLIMEAETARDEKDFKRLSDLMTNYRETIKNERQQTQDLYDNMIKWNKEVREKTKADRDAQADTAKSIAGALTTVLGNDEKENNRIIREAAISYGVDPNILISEIDTLNRKDVTAGIKEYEYAKAQGYKGSFMQYENAKQAAGRANNNPSVLTSDEASRYQLPEELIGKSDLDIIQDLSVSKVPDWFVKFKQKGPVLSTPEQLKSEWNTFRNSDDFKVYKSVGQGVSIKDPKETRGPLFE